jgi:hypothetical protein
MLIARVMLIGKKEKQMEGIAMRVAACKYGAARGGVSVKLGGDFAG